MIDSDPKATMDTLSALMDRTVGKPKQSIDVTAVPMQKRVILEDRAALPERAAIPAAILAPERDGFPGTNGE